MYQFLDMLEKEYDIYCSMSLDVPICYCEKESVFPDLVYNIGGKNYFMPWESYVVIDAWWCYIMMLTHDVIDEYILGLNFLANYYTVFD